MFNQKWVFNPSGTMTRAHEVLLNAPVKTRDPNANNVLVNNLRPPTGGRSITGSQHMPMLFGDDYFVDGSYLKLPLSMHENLQRWMIQDYDLITPNTSISPEGLDRAALESCVGGAFCPGIECSWMIRNPNLYAEPFRLKPPGTVLNKAIGLKLEAGFFTQQLALPWQTDFLLCAEQVVNDDKDKSISRTFGWWPAIRPVDVNTARPVFPAGVPQLKIEKWTRSVPTSADDTQNYLNFINAWPTLGFVVADAPARPTFPTVFIEKL